MMRKFRVVFFNEDEKVETRFVECLYLDLSGQWVSFSSTVGKIVLALPIDMVYRVEEVTA